MLRALGLASIGFVLACASPAPKPQPAAAELVIPPMPDAGAPVAVRRPPPPSEPPPPKSEAPLDDEECHKTMLHVVTLQMGPTGLSQQQVQQSVEAVLRQTDLSAVCTTLDEPTRRCMLAAKTMADVAACGSAMKAHRTP